MDRISMFIDGSSHESVSREWFPTDDPFRGTTWAEVARGARGDVDLAVTAAARAGESPEWGGLTASARGRLMLSLADTLDRHAERLAEIEVRDNGKLLAEMSAQTRYLPEWYRYFGGLADKVEGTVPPIDKAGYLAYTRREPIGVVAIITPWNSPLMLLAWKLAPALAAGCTVVVKPSEFTSASTVEMVRLLHEEGGLPAGVVNVVTGFGAEVGSPLVQHPLVRKISFTGSDATGRVIAEQAASSCKRVTLELGGKSPNIVFADADLDAAVNGVVSGIFAATGQTCIAGSRLLVERSIHDDFVARVVALASTARMGDPRDLDTQVGPVTTRQQLDKVRSYIDIAKREGATAVLGGEDAVPGFCDGWFVQPTIFTDVSNSMRIAQEEVFGPVLAVVPFDDEDDAVRIANDSRYGLGAGVWTTDIGRAFRMSERLQAGTVWINTYRVVSYLAPFGGVKHSGYGRESGLHAIDEYLETKTVWVNVGAPPGNPFVIR